MFNQLYILLGLYPEYEPKHQDKTHDFCQSVESLTLSLMILIDPTPSGKSLKGAFNVKNISCKSLVFIVWQ